MSALREWLARRSKPNLIAFALLLVIGALALVPPPAQPLQKYVLGPDVYFTLVSGTPRFTNESGLAAVILWRGDFEDRSPSKERRRRNAAFVERVNSARRRGEDIFGTYSRHASVDSNRFLTIEGVRLDLGQHDSALVVMAAIDSASGRRSVDTARIGTHRPWAFLAQPVRPGMPQPCGVPPKGDCRIRELGAALRTNPKVTRFLDVR